MVTRQYFEHELAELHNKIIHMGVAVENSIGDTITALSTMDSSLAKEIINNDDIVDDMELEIEKMCIDIIVKQQPVARDLRDVTSTLKLITDLERIADHSSDISEKIINLSTMNKIIIHEDIITMANIAKEMLNGALDSYVTRNADIARSVISRDDRVDELFVKLKADLVAKMTVDSQNVAQYVEIMLICKYFERIADHAQNVAEWVLYYIMGEH